jgi:putative hydrolase of the HAD superfamily
VKIILWDFDGTLAYREGMWPGTVYSLLEKNGVAGISIEDIRPHLMHKDEKRFTIAT